MLQFRVMALAISSAFSTLSASGWLALPLVEKESMATLAGTSRKALQLRAVAMAISASAWASGLGLTAQSAKRMMPFSPKLGVLVTIRKKEETVLMPGAVPTVWKAALSTFAGRAGGAGNLAVGISLRTIMPAK